MKFPKISSYWLLAGALTAGGAIFAWYNGESIDPSPYKRVMYVCVIGAFAVLARANLTGGWRRVVRIAPRDGAKKHEREASARVKSTESTVTDVGSSRSEKLEMALRDRHGRRWRYRDRWIAVVGDEQVVERMTPGLIESGFVVSASTVLLYARQSGDVLDTNWLEQIRAMRRGRPVDAMVAIEQSGAQSGPKLPGTQLSAQSTSPFDGQAIAQKLARHARALRWAAPAYMLNVLDLGRNALVSSEVVGETWGEAHVGATELNESLHALAARLADAGVARLLVNSRDRFIGELSCHIDSLRHALTEMVAQAGVSLLARCSVHGLLFASLPIDKTAEELVTFREKFLFVDLCGLDVEKLPEDSTRFELEIVLTHPYPSDQRFNEDNVRLFCTPVINLFELDAEPIVNLFTKLAIVSLPSQARIEWPRSKTWRAPL
ncbi:uncharacterized protein BRPE67_DCDS05250 (plasmid) [Caballeronia cordobensis]|nr:uncharacterized protein BRPE67_DCDS05250 [Burkholderia sp. RPE67]